MKIGITGVTGLIGNAIAALAKQRGHSVTGFSRKPHPTLAHCDDTRNFSLELEPNLAGLDAVIHLAGEPIIGLWTRAKHQRIIASRRDTTRHLVQAMAKTNDGPGTFLCASGTGFYGHRGAEKLHELSGHGIGFLSEVAEVWEDEARAAESHGFRSCQLRTGMVLAKNGGAFPLLRGIFSIGLGGKSGSGQQFLPWIHLDDVARLYLHALENATLSGPINAVAPDEITNLQFTQALGAALHRPTIFPAPEFVLRTALGDLSSIILDSQRVEPRRAHDTGFSFEFQSIQAALADLV